MNATGTNTDKQHQRDGDDRRGDLGHGAFGRLAGRQLRMLLHHPFDVFHHHDGVVDDDADRQHDGEQRHRVGRIADGQERDERADQADRHCKRRNQGGANAAEEKEDHDDDEDEGLDQGLLHLVDGVGDEHRGVVSDFPGQIVGKPLLRFGDAILHRLQGVDRIGAGRLIDRDRRRRAAVEPGVAIEIGGAELKARDVAEAEHRAVGIGPDHDIGEFLHRGEAALGLDIELQLLIVGDRPGADAADRGLDILRLDRVDDVAGGQVEPGQPIGAHPGAHGVILRAPYGRVADAGRAFDPIEQVDGDVIGEEQRIVGVLGRIDRDDAEQRRGFLLHRDALALHVRRQLRQRHLDPVVDVDGVDVGIGAELERRRERIAAVVAARALHVDHLVDADDLRLDDLGDGRFHDGGVGAGIKRRDRDLRRHDIRILRQRDGVEREQAGDRGDDGDDDGEPRTVDEDCGQHRI